MRFPGYEVSLYCHVLHLLNTCDLCYTFSKNDVEIN